MTQSFETIILTKTKVSPDHSGGQKSMPAGDMMYPYDRREKENKREGEREEFHVWNRNFFLPKLQLVTKENGYPNRSAKPHNFHSAENLRLTQPEVGVEGQRGGGGREYVNMVLYVHRNNKAY